MARACHSPASSIRPSLGYQLQPLREGGFAGMEREQNAIDLLGLVELTLAVHGPSEHGRRRLGGRRIDRRRGGMCSANIGAPCRLRRWPAPVRNALQRAEQGTRRDALHSGRLWRVCRSGPRIVGTRSATGPVFLAALRTRPRVPFRCHDAAEPDGTGGEATAPQGPTNYGKRKRTCRKCASRRVLLAEPGAGSSPVHPAILVCSFEF